MMYNVVDYLENSSKKYPNKIAIIEENKQITYQDFNNYSKIVGSYLGQKIFNKPIIVFMDKGIDALIAFFGAIYAGCFYSLINPELPKTRIEKIKDTLNANIVITNKEYYSLAQKYFKNLEIYQIEELKMGSIDSAILTKCYQKHIDCDPLYVNFTSGSTGIPKGVIISHRSVIDFIDIFTNLFNFRQNDIIGNQAPFDFDVSVKDIYSTIKMGATLVIIPKKYFSNPALLLDYISIHKVTVLTWAVSALCLITTFHGLDYKVPETVKKVLFSGEVMPLKHLKIWLEKLPQATFVNLYGPTEITCNCLYHVIDRNRIYKQIPIGIPFPNERVMLLDEKDNLIKHYQQTGEICVAGTALGLGYYNNFEHTNNHFIQNPNNFNYLDMFYRTGDLGYINEFNEIVFSGRKDFQIKYLGHRIELEEIEKAIMENPKVTRSCCVFDKQKEKLYGFYIGNIEKKELHIQLTKILPNFMIPTKLIKKEDFPMTKNGKIDRNKLLKMEV